MPLDLAALREARPQNTFHYFASTGSTMTEAAQLLAAGAAHGAVVVADEQTAGVGRFGRQWISEPEAGIYTSILLRLPLASSDLPVASLLIGLATAEAIKKASQLACDLRWPNDVLISERKVAGILPQLVAGLVIAGIGINVNNKAFPADLRTPATSLFLASGGRRHSREHLIIELLRSIDSFSELLATSGRESILRAFSAASSYVRNRRVIVEENGMRATTCGLDEHGFLLVSDASGSIVRISSGGIRPDRGEHV
jgi:BirA family biotin operon repressor/biotin-[acetyl-CoA-carboxylase] ligase